MVAGARGELFITNHMVKDVDPVAGLPVSFIMPDDMQEMPFHMFFISGSNGGDPTGQISIRVAPIADAKCPYHIAAGVGADLHSSLEDMTLSTFMADPIIRVFAGYLGSFQVLDGATPPANGTTPLINIWVASGRDVRAQSWSQSKAL